MMSIDETTVLANLVELAFVLIDGHAPEGTEVVQGFYNRNYLIDASVVGVACVIRIPIPNAGAMDERHLHERDVLGFINTTDIPAPALFYADSAGRFLIMERIPGGTIDHLWPEDTLLPDSLTMTLAEIHARIHHLSPCGILPTQQVITYSGTLQHVRAMAIRCFQETPGIHERFGIPPLEALIPEALQNEKVVNDAVTFCHCDIHRKNVLVHNQQLDHLTVIDWELAKYAPPAYDLSTHLHKMRYSVEQEQAFLTRYAAQYALEHDAFAALAMQINQYRSLEQIKSAIVDTTRCLELYRTEGRSPRYTKSLRMLVRKLAKAATVWQCSVPGTMEELERWIIAYA